jgi:hypothetical protein
VSSDTGPPQNDRPPNNWEKAITIGIWLLENLGVPLLIVWLAREIWR